ncbi:TPA: hypothetical protein ACH3X2_003891 [Trebouxia sp. C0005]
MPLLTRPQVRLNRFVCETFATHPNRPVKGSAANCNKTSAKEAMHGPIAGFAVSCQRASRASGCFASKASRSSVGPEQEAADLPAQKPGVTTSTGPQASSIEDIPGQPQSLQGKVLEAAEGAIQQFSPFSRIHQHVCGFHFYAHDITRQVEAHHFCACPNEDVRQCVIYDSDKPNARLIGLEYIISSELFEGLPEEEKVYWHSHKFEVSSGTLQAPRVPVLAEDLEMKKLINTYGKTFHTWQVDRGDTLPLGPPQLMMAFTEEGQADPLMVAKRDKLYGTNSDERKEHRRKTLDFSHQPSSAADHWMQGKGAHQLQTVKMDFKSGELSAYGCYTGAHGKMSLCTSIPTHQVLSLMLRMAFSAIHSLLLPR